MFIIHWCMEKRFFLLCIIILLMVAGIADIRNLPVSPVPDISPREVLVTIQAPGVPAEDVEKFVTSPIEKVMSGVIGLRGLRSVSRTGIAVLYLQFDDSTDIYHDRELVSERLPEARESVAIKGTSVSMGPMTTGMGEILQFQIKGRGKSLEELNRIMVWNVVPELRLVPGVVDVNVNGGGEETYEIALNPFALRRYGISVSSVFQAIDKDNRVVGGAWIEHNDEQHIIVGNSLIDNLSELGSIRLRSGSNGEAVFVRDVAVLRKAHRPRLGGVTRDGKGEIVIGTVLLQQGANALVTLKAVQVALQKIQKNLPPGVTLDPFYDRAILTKHVISTVRENLILGALLVLAVLFVVIGHWRASLVIISVIPFSLIMAMVGMRHLGISANLLSLGAIDFGMVVDSSLVIVENVLHRRTYEENLCKTIGKTVSSVIRPVTFAVMIITLVYLPVLTLQDVEGRMFRPMAQTVILALMASLVYSLVCIPALCMFLGHFKTSQEFHQTTHQTKFIAFLWRYFQPISAWCMHNTRKVVSIAVVFLCFSALLVTRLGGEFIPQLQEGDLVVTSTRLPSIALGASLKAAEEIEQTLMTFPEVKSVVSNTGTAAIPTDPMGVGETDSYVLLKPRSEWKTATTQEGLVKAFNAALIKDNPGSLLNWSQPIQMRMDDLLEGVRSQVAIGIYGPDLETLAQLATRISDVISRVPGAADVAPQDVGTVPYLHIDVDRKEAARLNVSTSDVLDVVGALQGYYSSSVSVGDALIPIQIRFIGNIHDTLEDINFLPVFSHDGKIVNLSQVTDTTLVNAPPAIRRDHGMRCAMVQVNVRGRDLSSFVQAAQAAVRKHVRIPQGYSIEWSGQFKNLQTAVARLEIVVPIMLGLIFFLLLMALGEMGLATLVFVNLPFAATGGVIALYVRGMPFSISAGIGFIALFGVATMNGLVLVSCIQELRKAGASAFVAAVNAVRERFCPVVATATVACLGFFPMAFSTGDGAEVEKPLAMVVIGGLVTCTILTLLVLPTIYAALYGRKSTFKGI